MKVISWNLLRLIGASAHDIAVLLETQRPDLMLMQEATDVVDKLSALAGGYMHRTPMPGRIYGLAVWSSQLLPIPETLMLPISTMPGGLPGRIAQIVRHEGMTLANVHLSHGQLLNRRQLLHIVTSLEGPVAVIGDFNAVGPTLLRGFRDVGPRQPTFLASNILPFRLDRCLVRGLDCVDARTLGRGSSDHRPILLDLEAASGANRHRRLFRVQSKTHIA